MNAVSAAHSKPSMSFRSWRLGFVLSFVVVAPQAFAKEQAFANETAPADAQAVLESQLSAFARDDALGAWGFAAPEVQKKFESAANFIGMVKSRYGPVAHHRSADFGPAARRGDEVGVVVTLVGEDNEVWSALFTLSKQSDGGWKTTGCLLAKAPETSL